MSSTLARNFLIQTLGKTLSVALGLFTLSLLTHALGPAAFGEYTTAVTFLQFFGVIVDFGLSLTLVVMIAEPGADEKRIVGNIFALRMVSALVCFAIAPLAVLAFPWSVNVKHGVLIGAFGYACMSGATMLMGVFQKHRAVWRASVGELINRVVLLVLCALLLRAHLGVSAVIWALTIANVVWLAAMLVFARPLVPIRPQFDFAIWKRILVRSWPMALSIFFNLIYLKGDILALALFRSQTEVGHYGAAYRVIDVLTVIPTIFMGLVLPSLVEDWKSGRKEEFARHLQRAFNVFCILFLPMVAGTQALAIPILHFVAAPSFDASGRMLQWLIWALPGVFLAAIYGHAVVAIDRQRRMLPVYAVCAVVCAAGYALLIPRFGTVAAASVTIASEWFIAVAGFFVVSHDHPLHPRLGIALRALLAAVGMYTTLRFLPPMPVLVAIIIGAVIYALLLFLFGGVSKRTLQELMPQKLAAHRSE